MAPPIPTIPFLTDELVAIRIPGVELAVSTAFPLSGSMVAGNRSSHAAITYGLMPSIRSVGACRCARAIFCSGEVNLSNALVPSFESGFVSGNVRS